ncbi:type IV secretion system DNA-binding domain-containing protein [Candidatus Cardinium hertigii]|uniref:type IV secretion system DNA-binding domain-containing protein n=1 Tax=Candidatus Cardinium hertigii TaxID=247481 RepID=UPI003D7D3DDC
MVSLPKGYDKTSPFSIAIPTKNGKLPINNPQRGIYILGGAGSGKSIYVLEPILYAMIKKGYCGIVYDYNFEGNQLDPTIKCCLSKFVYNCYYRLPEKERKKLSFKTINFTDLNKSSRINPIDPVYISNRAYLEEYVTVLLKNLNPGKKDDFWHVSTKSLLQGMIIYMSNKAPKYCTLPHVLMLSTKPIDKLLGLIEQDEEAYIYSSSIFDAYKGGEKSSAQLIGILASFKTSLLPLINNDLFWVLSKNEINLTINDSTAPTLLCIGNFPPAKSAFSPVISLLLTVCFKSMYGHSRTKSFVAIDELPTLYIPDISEVPATARKYGISTIACIQSNAQLEDTYGYGGAKKLRDILTNQFIGSCGVESLGYASSLFGKEAHIIKSTSSSETYHPDSKSPNTTRGENVTIHDKDVIQSNEFSNFEVGYFAGKVVESEGTFFQEQFKPVSDYDKQFKNKYLKELPDVAVIDAASIIENTKRIKEEVNTLVV